jgi:hypothetical protein
MGAESRIPRMIALPCSVKTFFRELPDAFVGVQKFSWVLRLALTKARVHSGRHTLDGMHDLICRVRAQANQHLMTILNEWEMTNAGHFQRLCSVQR